MTALTDSINRNREEASAEAHRLANHRDEMSSKYLFGLASFNAASIVAVLAAVGTSGKSLQTLGIGTSSLKYALIVFTLGVIFAGVAIAAAQNHLTVRAGYAAARVTSLGTAIAALQSGSDSDETFRSAHDQSHALSIEGLKISFLGIATQNLSAGAWLCGAMLLAASLFGWR